MEYLLEFIENDFEITKISFDDNEIITTTYDNEEEEENNDEDSNMEDNKTIEKDIGTFTMVENQKHEIKFTITDLPVELLNYIYLKDGLSFGLTSKDIYNSIYYNNNLFIPNKIIENNIIPLIMTTIYNKFNEKKLIKNKECDKIFKKLIYQSSQINALDDQWFYKALYNINNCIFLQQKVHMDHVDPIMYCNIKIMNDNNNFLEFKEIYEYANDLLEEIDEKQLRKYLDLEDQRVTIDLICKCLKYCSPFKFEFIEYCEENNCY